MNEIRKDYLLNRWVVIAADRGLRPTDLGKSVLEQPKKKTICPFCPGNEHITPPSVLTYIRSENLLIKTHDQGSSRIKDWEIRVVPNLYPAFSISPSYNNKSLTEKNPDILKAVGHHEVVIESPIHDEHPANAKLTRLIYVIQAYHDRIHELSQKSYVKYISIFRNHGLEAGASLSHPHSQIISMPMIPRIVQEELDNSRIFWKKTSQCKFCDILAREIDGPRFIWRNKDFIVFSPRAGVNPLEFWIVPTRHMSSLLKITKTEIKNLAKTLKITLQGLHELIPSVSYNYAFHTTFDDESSEYYHWHLEVYPKLSTYGGFEKSTGVYINTVSPEIAADMLRTKIIH